MIQQMEAVQPATSTLPEAGERTQAQEDQLSKRYSFIESFICMERFWI